MGDIVERLREYASDDHERGCQGRYYDCSCGYDGKRDPLLETAAARIAQLEAEVKTWQGHAKTAIWGDSEECKSLSAEVDRLVRSRNKWGQRYNKLLLKIRAGESGETDDPASWQLRMALDDANVKNDEAADRIEQLEEANELMLTDIRRTDVDMLAFKARIAQLEAALDTVRASGLLIGSTTLHDRVRSAVYNAIDARAALENVHSIGHKDGLCTREWT